MKKFKPKSLAFFIAMGLMGVLLIGTAGVLAYSVIQDIKVAGDYNYYEAAEQPPLPEDIELGAFPGPDIYSDYMCFNEVCYWYNSVPMRTATDTICSIKSPVASSTLIHASAYFSVSTTSASNLVIAKDSTAYATTTALNGAIAIEAGEQKVVIASTSPDDANFAPHVIEPNYFINFGMNSGTSTDTSRESGSFSPVGTCKAIFLSLD